MRLSLGNFKRIVEDPIYHVNFDDLSSLTLVPNSSYISQANNLVGDNHLVQTEGSLQPTSEYDSSIGRHVSRYRSDRLYSENGNIFSTDTVSKFTIFFVKRVLATSANVTLSFNGDVTDDSTRFFMYHPYGPTRYIYDLGNSGDDRKIIESTDEGFVDPLEWVVSTSVKDIDRDHNYISLNDSDWFVTAHCSPAHAEGGVMIGRDADAYMGELIVYDKVLSEDTIRGIQKQLMYDWGII